MHTTGHGRGRSDKSGGESSSESSESSDNWEADGKGEYSNDKVDCVHSHSFPRKS